MSNLYEKKAREIACNQWASCSHPELGHSSMCNDLTSAISAALSQAAEAERRTIMAKLGYDENGGYLTEERKHKGLTVSVSEAADENLDAAIYDLERTQADAVCITTISRVRNQIMAVVDYARSAAIRSTQTETADE